MCRKGYRKRYRVHGLRFRGLGLLKAEKVGSGGGVPKAHANV